MFIKIHLHIHNLQDDQKIHSWIYQITRHTIIDYYRRRKRDTIFTQTVVEQEDLFFPNSLDAHEELSKCLKEMINDLPASYREAIQSTEFQGMTQKELGQQMGLSLSGAKSRVQRGSGGGFDCFLAAKQVGDQGKVIGVDMTPEMISKARSNESKGGFTNTEFRLGEIENLPVPNETVHVIISN